MEENYMQVLAHNLLSQFTNRQLSITSKEKGKSTEKLSSGYRINRSADDAAGLQISEKMRSQVRGLTQASRNIQDGVSLCQVADGALNETHSILQRMRELSVQAANDTNQEVDRDAIQSEINELTKEVDRIAKDTSFNHGIYPLINKSDEPSLDTITTILGSNYDIKNVKLTMISHPDSQGTIDGQSIVGPVTFSAIKIGNISYLWDTGVIDDATLNAGAQVQHNRKDTYSLNTSELEIDSKGYVYFNAKSDGMKSYIVMNKNTGKISCITNSPQMLNPHEELLTATSKDVVSNTTNIESNDIWIQTGANYMQGISLNLVDATAKGIGITDPALDVTSYDNANTSISRLDNAINQVSAYRSQFGTQQNRLEYAKSVDDNTAENTQYAESRIRDVDMAEEMVKYAKHNILEQAGQSMLTHANQSTQGILALLQ